MSTASDGCYSYLQIDLIPTVAEGDLALEGVEVVQSLDLAVHLDILNPFLLSNSQSAEMK